MIPPNSLPSVREHLLSHLICFQFENGPEIGFDPAVAVAGVQQQYSRYGPDDIGILMNCLEKGLENALSVGVALIRTGTEDRLVLSLIQEELESAVGTIKNVGQVADLAHLLAEIKFCKEAM